MTAPIRNSRKSTSVVEVPIVLATPYLEFARLNHIGQGKIKKDIASGALRVIQAGRKLLVTADAGRIYLESFPLGPFARPENFNRKKVESAK